MLTATTSLPADPASQADAQPQSTPIDRQRNLSRREFIHEYQIRRRPVILEDATDHWAASSWTPESLCRRIGDKQVLVRGTDRCYRFDELTELIHESTPENPAPYGRNLNVHRDLPELLPDIQPRLKYATPDWKSSRLLPKDWLFQNGLEEVFYGGRGASFPVLHVDYWGMDGFISQMYGEKEFTLFSPEDTPFLYQPDDDPLSTRITDLDHVDLTEFPLYAKANMIRFMLQPGETLYNPSGWWHTTRMHNASITVITATWNASNWRTLISEIRRNWSKDRPFKARIMTTYLAGVGKLLSIRDAVLNGIGRAD
ncbi:MAG: cupin-like domain-containing protein [Planctomycetota bacterium]|nr:cupin-like domain-containing protein [Planctomycetota bacterium]